MMIFALIADLFIFSRRYRIRRPRAGAHQGATVSYAGELHVMASQAGWLSDIEEEEQTSALDAIDADLARLDHIEQVAMVGLNRLWLATCKALHLDPIDIEWAVLASGELSTV